MHSNKSATPATANVIKAHHQHSRMQQSRARMLTAHTCSNSCRNRLRSTSDGSHPTVATSLPCHISPDFQTYTLARTKGTRTRIYVAVSTGSILATASRQSKIGPIDQPRQHACKPRYDRIPEVSKQPASSLHRSPTLSQTVRGQGHSPITVSRWSKIGRVDRLRQLACKHRYDRIAQDRQTARAVAPSLPDTLADCAWPRAQSHLRFSTVENRSLCN